jgi:hypothetical protein
LPSAQRTGVVPLCWREGYSATSACVGFRASLAGCSTSPTTRLVINLAVRTGGHHDLDAIALHRVTVVRRRGRRSAGSATRGDHSLGRVLTLSLPVQRGISGEALGDAHYLLAGGVFVAER